MKKYLKLFVLIFAFVPDSAWAQQAQMADTMRSEGKIYVVVAILLVILVGLIFYLFTLDRKLKRLEDEAQSLRKH